MSKRRRLKIPNEVQLASVHSLSHEGRGIAQVNNKPTFITNALPSEEVEFQYTSLHGKYAEGRATRIIQSSPARVAPHCPYFGTCGGCSLQHLRHEDQLALKQTALKELLAQIAHIEPQAWLTPMTGLLYGYRHKARLGVRYVAKKETVLVGFREIQSRYLADMDSCAVLHPSVGNLITPLRQLIAGLSVFDQIAQIEVAVSDTQTALVFRNMAPLSADDETQLRAFAQTHALLIYLQPGAPSTIARFWPLDEDPYLYYRLEAFDVTFAFHPTDFTQVNPSINQQMVPTAIGLLDIVPTDRVLDLFCGLGNFTLPLSRSAQHVVGIEGSTEMVERALMNQQRNGISNAEFHALDLTQPLPNATWATQRYDKLLLDPARSGALEVLPHLAQWQPQKIVYVSCNPATLARDTATIIAHGYRLEKAGIIDMFPHTNHVESIAVFIRGS